METEFSSPYKSCWGCPEKHVRTDPRQDMHWFTAVRAHLMLTRMYVMIW